jgi:predicted RNase H-like HicB family nuclease
VFAGRLAVPERSLGQDRRRLYGKHASQALVAGTLPCQNTAMENRYTGVFEQVGDWWIGHVEELPGCNVQEDSLDEARESLKEAVQLIVQANRELARRESEGHEVVREALAVSVE